MPNHEFLHNQPLVAGIIPVWLSGIYRYSIPKRNVMWYDFINGKPSLPNLYSQEKKSMRTNETLGARLQRLRKERNMTQDEAAERLNVSPQAVSKWENEISHS